MELKLTYSVVQGEESRLLIVPYGIETPEIVGGHVRQVHF